MILRTSLLVLASAMLSFAPIPKKQLPPLPYGLTLNDTYQGAKQKIKKAKATITQEDDNELEGVYGVGGNGSLHVTGGTFLSQEISSAELHFFPEEGKSGPRLRVTSHEL